MKNNLEDMAAYPSKYDLKTQQSQMPSKYGYGVAFGHCGELVQGLVRHQNTVNIGLVTLPCDAFFAQAWFSLEETSGVLTAPEGCMIAHHAARLTLQSAGKQQEGRLILRKNAPVGGGVGSSTLDALASIRAICNFYNHLLSGEEILKICLQAEIASDPIMFSEPERLLFDSRAGICLKRFESPPPLWIVFGFDGDGANTPLTAQWPDISDLIIPLERAFAAQSPEKIARIASESAQRSANLTYKPHWQDVVKAAQGRVFAAHTGALVGMICDTAKMAQEMSYTFSEIGIQGLQWGYWERGRFAKAFNNNKKSCVD